MLFQRCDDVDCCGECRSPAGDVRDLVMQRQPTPIRDPIRKGHFLRREQAFGESTTLPRDALVDLSDLPSNVGDPKKEEARKRAKRDVDINKALGLKSWDGKKVRAIVTCFHCMKRRCIFTVTDADFSAARVALHQKLESVSGRYSCGDLLFDDSHPLSKVIVQKQSLTCESPIEKGYYNKQGRALSLKDVCIHCGEQGGDDFLLKTPQLQSRSMTGGYKCFPICVYCLENGKKVVKMGGKKDASQERAERIAASNN
jgi:hypothetical protein